MSFLNNFRAKTILNFVILFTLLVQTTKCLAQKELTLHIAKKIYTSNNQQDTAECFATKNGYLEYVGDLQTFKQRYLTIQYQTVNHKGYLYPGFFDAHCHFLAYARGTKELNVSGIQSPEKIAKLVKKFSKKTNRSWIIGRGWDQNIWSNQQFPTAKIIDAKYNLKPVCLSRVDGHAVWLNTKAMEILKLNLDTQIAGGEILKDATGKASGVFIDNAADWIKSQIPPMSTEELTQAILNSLNKCYENGLTSIDEAGISYDEIDLINSLQKQGKMKLKVYGMLHFTPENIGRILKEKVFYGNPKLNVRSMKFYLDGALGSRGALLKHDYCDRLHHRGFQVMSLNDFTMYSTILMQNNFQVCVHAIGDSANSLALKIFQKIIPENYDVRWRIEHAQIVSPTDIKLFSKRSIIPSVQPTHATSDAPWAMSRLCLDSTLIKKPAYNNRFNPVLGAYAYQNLLKSAGTVALGTDFPVEQMSTLATFYSATQRKDIAGKLTQPFIPQQALSRKDALYGMTIWAARANFEEDYKGSLEKGKMADFIEINTDLITATAEQLQKAQIQKTYVDGELVWKK